MGRAISEKSEELSEKKIQTYIIKEYWLSEEFWEVTK